MEHLKAIEMKEQKIELKTLKIKSFLVTPEPSTKNKTKINDGGYTWVG